jgi:antitoxin component of MazEF toxin-antitoxin module
MIQKIIKIGDSVGITIPKSALKELNMKAGDEVYVEADVVSGSLLYTPVKKNKMTYRQSRIANITLAFINRYRKDLEALKDK